MVLILVTTKEEWVVQPPRSCSIDLHDVVISGGQHQHLLCMAVVEDLSRAKGFQPRHGHTFLLLIPTTHRVNTAPTADAGCVPLVVKGFV